MMMFDADSDSEWNKKVEEKIRKGERRRKSGENKSCSVSSQPGPSSRLTSDHKTPLSSLSIKKFKHENGIQKGEIPVICGNKEGILYKKRFAKKIKCILSHGRWFTVHEFEKEGGMERNKNWKLSIRHRDQKLSLKTLITKDILPNLSFLGKKVQDREVWNGKKNKKPQKSSTGSFYCNSVSSRPQAGTISTRERKEAICEEEDDRGEEGETAEEKEDLSSFQAPFLPVSCGPACGVLHKSRFASGRRSKSIRTEERWLTPEEFVNQELNLTHGHWREDIQCHGKTLDYLLKKKILSVHSLSCKCYLCCEEEQPQQNQDNDDMCYVCNSEGYFICCEECPRSFHFRCHIPAVKDNLLGGTWICTICVWKNNQNLWLTRCMTQTEALRLPVSQYTLQCEYLLLRIYTEDVQQVFTEDPCGKVPGYTSVISQPMWLDRVKMKLQNNAYNTVEQLVSDVRLIFQNCQTFNKDNTYGVEGSRLSEVFEKEFQTVFNIQ